MSKGTRKTKPRSQWRTVRAVVEVSVLSPDYAPYTDKDLVHDLIHLVGGSQLNQRNRPVNYKLHFSTVEIKEALRMVDKLQRIRHDNAKKRLEDLERVVKGLSNNALIHQDQS